MKWTVKEIALWLSEAWGDSVKPSNVRLRGDWIFVRYPSYVDILGSLYDPTWGGMGYRQKRDGWEAEVDCISVNVLTTTRAKPFLSPRRGDVWAEPWDGIPYEKSPFVATPEVVAETIVKLDREHGAYIAEREKSNV